MMKQFEKPHNATSVSDLFGSKIFRIPDYQRPYSWDKKNWEDFWGDIKEGLITETPHYLGTITLRETDQRKYVPELAETFTLYEVVDGQQRLLTTYLFLLALSRNGKEPLYKRYIKCGDNIYRLELGGLNRSFLERLVAGEQLAARLKTNKRIQGAYNYFSKQIQTYGRQDDLTFYIQSSIFTLEFQVKDEYFAIKAFETLNDRGKPLTLLDKAKSFLMFYSSLYAKDVNPELTNRINENFGNVFRNYDLIDDLGESLKVSYIENPRYRFSEDELLRFFYHYFAEYAIEKFSLKNNDITYDYTFTTQEVFEEFLKKSCMILKNNSSDDNQILSDFIEDFSTSFDKFVEAFRSLLEKAQGNLAYRKLFSFIGLNAAVYPLVVSLHSEGLIDEGLLSLIEILDLRVYKIRGTDPRSDLYRETISKIKTGLGRDRIYTNVYQFITRFMSDIQFQNYLENSLYKNPATKYILWEYQKQCSSDFDDSSFDLYNSLQIEHIFPQTPTFAFSGYGFEDEAEYDRFIDKLGNLCLLESGLQSKSSVTNNVPANKTTGYQESQVPETENLAFFIENHGFNKQKVQDRTTMIIKFCLQRWPL